MFGQRKFLDINGNFDTTLFMEILSNSRHALKTGKKPSFKIKSEFGAIVIGGIAEKEIWFVVSKLGSFLTSGIDLKTAFSILAKQIKNPKLKQIIDDIRINLDHGLAISDTLKQHSKYFDPLIIALIEVGEKTGTLPRVLTELDKRLLETIELKAKIKGALIYPVILILITLIMVIFMMTFILPKITGAFQKTGVAMPALTQFMINISNFIMNNYILLIFGTIGFAIAFIIFKSTHIGKLALGKISLNLPVFGYIVKQGNVLLFIHSFSLLLDSGVLVLEALETTANVVGNIYYKKDIIRVKNEMETGVKLSNAMGLNVSNREIIFSNAYFPEDLVHMISIGEETGSIGKSMEKVGINYGKDLKRYISNLMTMLEPFIIVFVGALVGTIIIAIMLPFFNLAKVAKKM
ncbi:MAG: type II secretion system F family protein [Candidatus Gracilibacteria bacterium]|nr:type II secretion system F family protein [Candidatus Gracilibacteria bacterium]MDD2908897.1 type II secretion system F family protein [Candidatus Gracilibacteria bacterium]